VLSPRWRGKIEVRVIKEIEIEGFKSLAKVRLKLGNLNLFVGANASGKSNFLDALRVFQGIGYGLTIDEILNGKPKSASSLAWEGIRGGSPRAIFSGRQSREIAFRARVKVKQCREFSYSIRISPDYGTVAAESLEMDSKLLFDRTGEGIRTMSHYGLDEVDPDIEKERPALPVLDPDFELVLADEDQAPLKAAVQNLSDMQRIGPNPEILRSYGQLFLADRMGESGENFASLVKAILQDKNARSAYVSWLKKLTPAEVEDVSIAEGALGEPLFALKENGQISLAPVLSDGTLRFAALTAAFFQPDMPEILTIEEIENGIHPSRLRLLVELLKTQSGGEGPQVFATTHSPVVLAWLDESDYETTFFCRRDEETGASIIKPLSEIPHLVDLVKKQPLGELFTEGWMEGTS
jgi:predicted ATPase